MRDLIINLLREAGVPLQKEEIEKFIEERTVDENRDVDDIVKEIAEKSDSCIMLKTFIDKQVSYFLPHNNKRRISYGFV